MLPTFVNQISPMIVKELIERNLEIGLMELENIVHKKGGLLIRLWKTNKHWHVVYKL